MKDKLFRYALLLSLVSGCAALSHELLWTRRLVDLLGASNASTARVFGCFFLGLSLGSAWITRLTPRLRRPWLAVALTELGIALATLPAFTLPIWTQSIWPSLGPDRLVGSTGALVKLILSAIIVIPPSVLMGMALPLLAAATLNSERKLPRQGVWLYAINTAGGVVGLLVTSIVTVDILGVAGAMGWALTLNLAIAGGCFLLHNASKSSVEQKTPARKSNRKRAKKTDRQHPEEFVSQEIKKKLNDLRRPLLISFISGAGVLATEMLTLHLIASIAPSCLHTTTAVLTSVILLLAISAWLVPHLVPRPAKAESFLVTLLMLSAILLTLAPLFFMWQTGEMDELSSAKSVSAYIFKVMGCVLISVGPALLFSGMVLPVVFSWYGRDKNDPHGKKWGWLLAANGIGGLLGAEAANSLLMPWLGMHLSLGLLGLLYALAAAGFSVRCHGLSRATYSGGALSAVILILMFGPLQRLPLISPDLKLNIIESHSGPEGVVVVADQPSLGKAVYLSNRYLLGSTGGFFGQQRKTILPLLLHPDPKRVAAVGLATGISAGAALDSPSVESLVAMELSPLVTNAACKHFSEANRNICTDPRSQVVVEDGRTFIASTKNAYDVIIGDLYRPWGSGEGRMFSVEHFRAAKEALRPGGSFCQWLPMYQLTAKQFSVILKTFLREFPQAHLLRGSFRSSVPTIGLLGFRDAESQIDWTGLTARCDTLRETGLVKDPMLRHLEGVYMHYLGDIRDEEVDEDTINTLNNAWVELNAGAERVSMAKGVAYLTLKTWLDFEISLHSLLRQSGATKPDMQYWIDLGQKSCILHYAAKTGSTAARRLQQEVHAELPESMKNDSGADWAAFPVR